MIPRDYRATGAALTGNINLQINNHPDSFECLLYRADLSATETVADNEDVVGSMESSERAVTYADPIGARALRIVEGPFFQSATNLGDGPDGNADQPLVLVLSVEPVPEQSVIQYEEMVSEDDRRLVSVFVVRGDLIGSIPGGKQRHYCIPFQGFDGATP